MSERILPERIPDIPLVGETSVDIALFVYTREHREDAPAFHGDVDREIATIHMIDRIDVTPIACKLILPSENIDTERGGIIGEIEEAVTTDRAIFSMTYWMDTMEGIAKIGVIRVDDDFRRQGIATTFKNVEMEFMESKGIDLIYTDIVSEAGYRLAKKTGFRPIYEADHLYGEETTLTFNRGSNTGVMFKYL